MLLLDIHMPDANGFDLCKQVPDNYPDAKVIALTNHEETIYMKKMMRNGVLGYLLKNTDRKASLKLLTKTSMVKNTWTSASKKPCSPK